MLVTLFLLMLVQGLVWGDDEDKNNPMSCSKILENKENFTDIIPNGAEILFHCPDVKEYTDCLIRTVTETGLFFELEDLLSMRSFLDDMCDETSQLYQGYVNNFGCFKSVVDKWDGCKGIASGVIEEFRKSGYDFHHGNLFATEDEDIKEIQIFAEAHCLLNAHTFACIGEKMQQTCGHGTYELYVEILTRGTFLKQFCDGYTLTLFLKGYLDYLSLANNRTEVDIIRELFELETD